MHVFAGEGNSFIVTAHGSDMLQYATEERDKKIKGASPIVLMLYQWLSHMYQSRRSGGRASMCTLLALTIIKNRR